MSNLSLISTTCATWVRPIIAVLKEVFLAIPQPRTTKVAFEIELLFKELSVKNDHSRLKRNEEQVESGMFYFKQANDLLGSLAAMKSPATLVTPALAPTIAMPPKRAPDQSQPLELRVVDDMNPRMNARQLPLDTWPSMRGLMAPLGGNDLALWNVQRCSNP